MKILIEMKSKSTIPSSVLSREEEMPLNNLATRCFRNVADMDYINAQLKEKRHPSRSALIWKNLYSATPTVMW